MEMWVGVEPLLSVFVLSLPIIWIIDWRLSSYSSPNKISKYLSIFLLALLFVITFQAVIGHLQYPSHLHAVYWGVSESFFLAGLHFSNGPEGRVILIAIFYWLHIISRHRSKSIPVTVCSLPLLPLIAIGASAGSFEIVIGEDVSKFAPIPEINPLIISFVTGIILGEAVTRTIPLLSQKEIILRNSRFVIVLWILVILVISIRDSISLLSPVKTVFSVISLSSVMVLSDIIGGVSETLPESKGETWMSLIFSFLLIAVSLLMVYLFSPTPSLLGIGFISIFSVIGSQFPLLGFDKRNRSTHRWSVFGMGTAALLLVSFGALDEISIRIIIGAIILIPLSWNLVDRYSRSNQLILE